MFKNKKQIIILFSWVAVLLWMLLIFHLSSQVAEDSNELSKGVTEIVVETAEKVAPKYNLDVNNFNHIVRKNAHFFTYLVLGILVSNATKRSGLRGTRAIFFIFTICVFYAISDEIHQAFVPGRGPQVKDVFIDSAGSIAGIGLYLISSKIKSKAMT